MSEASGADWLDGLEGAGPFGATARAFAERHLAGAAARGVDGLRALASAIDRFAEDGDPRDEDPFLEGAGAYLSAVVIDRHRGRARHVARGGRHVLALGARGAFDPFAAVRAAASGEAFARSVLVEALTEIEAEIEGVGPLSHAALALEAALMARRPEVKVVARFDRHLELSDGSTIDLGSVVGALRGAGPTERAALAQRAAERMVSLLPGAPPLPYEEIASALRPRLVGPSMTAEVLAIPFRADVRIALVVTEPGRSRFVTASDPARWNVELDHLLERALVNLAASSATARLIPDGRSFMLRSGDGADSARLLLPGLWPTLHPAVGTPFLCAVPHRDVLLVAERGHRDALAAQACDAFARAPHRISEVLFEVEEGGIRAL